MSLPLWSRACFRWLPRSVQTPAAGKSRLPDLLAALRDGGVGAVVRRRSWPKGLVLQVSRVATRRRDSPAMRVWGTILAPGPDGRGGEDGAGMVVQRVDTAVRHAHRKEWQLVGLPDYEQQEMYRREMRERRRRANGVGLEEDLAETEEAFQRELDELLPPVERD